MNLSTILASRNWRITAAIMIILTALLMSVFGMSEPSEATYVGPTTYNCDGRVVSVPSQFRDRSIVTFRLAPSGTTKVTFNAVLSTSPSTGNSAYRITSASGNVNLTINAAQNIRWVNTSGAITIRQLTSTGTEAARWNCGNPRQNATTKTAVCTLTGNRAGNTEGSRHVFVAFDTSNVNNSPRIVFDNFASTRRYAALGNQSGAAWRQFNVSANTMYSYNWTDRGTTSINLRDITGRTIASPNSIRICPIPR